MKSKSSILLLLILLIPTSFVIFPNHQMGSQLSQILSPTRTLSQSSDPDLKIRIDGALLDSLDTAKVIVTFKEGVNSRAQLEILQQCFNIKEIHEFHVFSGANFEIKSDLVDDLARIEGVSKIYLNKKVQFVDLETPLTCSEDIDLEKTAQLIDARIPYTGKSINISILDTGIDSNHYDLRNKVLKQVSFVKTAYGWDADEVEGMGDGMGHGTHVAGIAAGTGLGALGLPINCTGIAPEANLFNAKCLDTVGGGYEASILAAIEWSIENGADIISMSLGFESLDPEHPIMKAVANATSRGIIVVVSAGNSGPWFNSIGYPGGSPSVITVGASNGDDSMTSFSSRGPNYENLVDPDVVAPGENVISALASGSVLEAMWQKMGRTIYSSSVARYFAASGTSMSAPAVSGVVALLKEAFPALTPEAARIALMETADSISNSQANVEGAGRINVTRCFEFLNSTPEWNNTGLFNLTTVLPKSLPTPPIDTIKFPGDSKTIDMLLLKSYPIPIKVIATGNASTFVKLTPRNATEAVKVNEKTLYVLSSTNLSRIKVDLYVPLSTRPSYYSGKIEILDNETGTSLRNVTLSFNISIPIGRVYFDNFHNYDVADSYLSNYHAFFAYLYDCGYAIDSEKTIITYEKLKNYDILLLPDIETMFTNDELQGIHKFWEEGGSILILASAYPSFAQAPLNNLLQYLDVGINFSNENLEKSCDFVVGKMYEILNITDIKPHPITTGLNNFSWLVGRTLDVDTNKAVLLADYGNKHLMAANETISGGKIVVMGGERHAYDDLIYENDNQKLIQQTFEWLLNDSSRSDQANLSVQLIANSSLVNLDISNKTEFGIYIWNKTSNSSVNGLIPGTNLNVTLQRFNGTHWEVVWEADNSNVTEIGDGAYHFEYNVSQVGTYNLSALVRNNPESAKGETSFRAINNSPEVILVQINENHVSSGLGYSEFENDIYRNGDNLTINATIGIKSGTLEDKVNVSLYLSSVNPYSRDANYSIFPMLNTSTLDSNEANFSITFAPDVTYSANEYSFFILVNDTSGFYNASLQKFVIQDEPPDIYESQSYIGAVPFTMQYSETYWGATIPISIVGTDEEDNISQMDAYFLIFNVMEVGMYLMAYDVVLSQKINYDEAAGRFSGSVHIPIDGISTMLNEKYYLGDHYYIAFAILRDSDGGWDETSYAYTLLIINTPLDLLIEFMQYYEEPTNYTPLIITICVASATAVIIAIYYLRSSKKEQVFLKKIIKGDETNVDSVIRDLLRDKKKQGDD